MKAKELKLIRWIREGVNIFLVIAFLIMFGAVLLQVAVRAFTNYTLVGTEEIASYAQIWLVLIGAGVALRFGRHVAVDLLVSFLPRKVRFAISLLNSAAVLWFLYLMFMGALPLISMGTFQKSPALALPMWTMYISLPIGAVYLALELALSLLPGDRADDLPGETIVVETA
jgi:TRAP-type C4-dicarboxylate transport system permease small subunit